MDRSSIWDRIRTGRKLSAKQHSEHVSFDLCRYAIVDAEIGTQSHKILDIGAIRHDGAIFHGNSTQQLLEFLQNVDYVCGHNIVHHDATYLFADRQLPWKLVDTLYVSPLLFPERPYHRLLKNEKIVSDQFNNPVNDCEKTKDLLCEEVDAWQSLPSEKRQIYTALLDKEAEFAGFLHMVNARSTNNRLSTIIQNLYEGKICQHADIDELIAKHPCALAYALALIDTTDHRSITPGWLLHNYPDVEWVLQVLRQTVCRKGCSYCSTQLDAHHNLKFFFGYNQFRTYDGEPLQERAARAAIQGKSLLAIFPTGGGKSLTFQLPALISGHSVHGLTVVISPLLSLMKDQVDNLNEQGISDAVTINGMLDPISRTLALERVAGGDASLLYIAPEMLRSRTIERILLSRNVVRFVIDEAHCFSSWGQDFRVDYLYIGQFIAEYQKKKFTLQPIPVSCFTATAKQKVVQDICDYFNQTLGLELELFASKSTRTNLHYSVIHLNNDDEKYQRLRSLIEEANCPTIVYVSRTKRTQELATRLTRDGLRALSFNGKMDADKKVLNQDTFMADQVRIIVATSAFGMGVDKKDVGLVVHYDISDSLENYLQEAGRAGRDPNMNARCYVLYSDGDLDKHFILLNQTKLSISEIQQVWKAVKELTRQRTSVNCSALEIARVAGWDDTVSDIETRVRTAISALEQGGYLARGNNVPHIYATGISVRNVDEARKRITSSVLFDKEEIEQAVRIIKSLISSKYTIDVRDAEAEARVDYLADILGMSKRDVVSVVERMRQAGILADSKDMTVYLKDTGASSRKSIIRLEACAQLEVFILKSIPDEGVQTTKKQLNDKAVNEGIETSREKDVHSLLNFLATKSYIQKSGNTDQVITLARQLDLEQSLSRQSRRIAISRFAIDWLYAAAASAKADDTQHPPVLFSIVELLNQFNARSKTLFDTQAEAHLSDMEEALLYLQHIGALKLDGGFLVLYNAMNIQRLKENKYRFRQEDYKVLDEFYKQKIQQIHIVGEYANLMVRDYNAALHYVKDYFQMDYKRFVAKYFKGDRGSEIQRNMTPQQYNRLFGQLSPKQMEIITDKAARCIVVAAGPGSGKTKVLVHKLASLLSLEDVKHEQLLMLTFSRAAATEFKQRLMNLTGNAAHFVEIKTFHAYCFDLLGRMGNLEEANDVVGKAAAMIASGEVEPNRICKTVLVIDEAQDMSEKEYALVKALMDYNEEIRVIAVGDDDQNIYEFRGSNSHYMFDLTKEQEANQIEMIDNYRSTRQVVAFANAFTSLMPSRRKTTPIVSKSSEEGYVKTTRHTSRFMYQPLVAQIKNNPRQGTVCVLTRTNEEAVIMVALLQRQGINSKLVQSLDGFQFTNIAEVRYFIKQLDYQHTSPLISTEQWQKAKNATFVTYAQSEALPYLRKCIELFEQTNKAIYYSDFMEYLHESSVEDFCDVSGAEVVVSTIHKAKGREYDDVYMLLDSKGNDMDAAQLRCYYVGITRAKKRLFIHTNSNLFANLKVGDYETDNHPYTKPEEVVLQLSHHDVFLDFFQDRKREVLALRSGDMLHYQASCLYNAQTGQIVATLSLRMHEVLKEWQLRGYDVSSAKVRFVVAWRSKTAAKTEAELAVLLVDLTLTCHQQPCKPNVI